jgi:hypothetical protein
MELKLRISRWFHDLPVTSVQATGMQARKSSVLMVMFASKGELEFFAIPHCVP